MLLHHLLQNMLRTTAAQEQDPPPNLPTDGCSQPPQGETCTVKCCAALYHCPQRDWCGGALEEARKHPVPACQEYSSAQAVEPHCGDPLTPRLSTWPGLSSQPILLCQGLTDTDSSPISWWDKNHPPHCSQPSSQSL